MYPTACSRIERMLQLQWYGLDWTGLNWTNGISIIASSKFNIQIQTDKQRIGDKVQPNYTVV